MSQHEIEQEIAQVELTKKQAEQIVEMGKKARDLADNPLFKELILDGYFMNEAARLVHLSSDPMLSDKQREDVNRDIQGVGGLKRYLRTLTMMADNAASELENSIETLAELRAEEGAE